MGNAVGVPTDEITEVAKEAMTTFTPIYIKNFGVALVKQMKEARQQQPNPYKLLKQPPASAPLHQGYATKQGGVRKNWKRRFFVAHNEADNYVVRYYEDEAAAKAAAEAAATKDKEKIAAAPKPRGEINLCWYRVEPLTDEDDKKIYGEHTVALRPWSSWDRRRHWYIRADSEDEAKKWQDTFEFVCRRAGPPKNPDPVLAAAFNAAYEETRWRLGEWGWWYYARSETDMLAQLVVDRCERTCMAPVYAKIPSGRAEAMIRGKVQNLLDQTVGAAVGAGWKAASESIAAAKPKIVETAEASLGVVIDKQLEIKNKIAAAILAQLKPGVDKVGAPVLGPITKLLLKPVAAAYEHTVRVWAEQMAKVVAARDGKATPAEADAAEAGQLDWLNSELYWTYATVFAKAFAACRLSSYKAGGVSNEAFTLSISLEDAVALLGDNITVSQIEDRIDSSIRQLVRNAIYTYRHDVAAAGAGAPRAPIVASVTARLVADLKTRAGEDLERIFCAVLLPPLRKNVLPPLQAAIDPIASLIPDALSSLLDINEMVTDIVEGTVVAAINDATAPQLGSSLAHLDALVPAGAAGAGGKPALQVADATMAGEPGAGALASPVVVAVHTKTAPPPPAAGAPVAV